MMRMGLMLCVVVTLAFCGSRRAVPDGIAGITWEPVGIGGGGGVFTPSISPHDEKLMFVACDMGGWYRSTDGGATWRMCDGRQVRKVNLNAVFHPTDPNVVYVGTRGGIKRSSDRGKTWEHVAGEFNPANPDNVRALAIDPANPSLILAGFDVFRGKDGSFLVVSTDAGKTWSVHPTWPFTDKSIRRILFDPASPADRRRILVATSAGF